MGGRGNEAGYNRWLGADNDAVVRVDEAWLDGAADVHVLPVPHAMMPFSPMVQRHIQAFLANGRFEHEG